MAVIDRVASKLGRNDEVPNQELARDLAARGATDEIAEIAAHLWDRDAAVRSDCIKVLDEIGSLNPALIAPYAEDFVRLLGDKQNRLVWGGMTALASIATITADTLYPHVAEIQAAMARGSVITVDQGVKTLAGIAAGSPERNAALFPLLLAHLETCRSKEVPQHAGRGRCDQSRCVCRRHAPPLAGAHPAASRADQATGKATEPLTKRPVSQRQHAQLEIAGLHISLCNSRNRNCG